MGVEALTPPLPCSHFFFLSPPFPALPFGILGFLGRLEGGGFNIGWELDWEFGWAFFLLGSTTTVPYSLCAASEGASDSSSLFGAFCSKLRFEDEICDADFAILGAFNFVVAVFLRTFFFF